MLKKLPCVAFLTVFLLAWSPEATFAQNKGFLVHATDGNLSAAISSIEAAGGTVVRTIDKINFAVVTTDNDRFVDDIAGKAGIDFLTDNPNQTMIDPNQQTFQASVAGNPPNSGDDDIFFDLQWGHDAVDAPEMWNDGYRGQGVTIAILDNGIDCTHPDITPNLLLGKSASFVPGEAVCVTHTGGSFFNHGTHVAGTAAAADNGFGTIGVAPQAKIMAVKVLSEFTGSGATDWVLAGIIHAVDQGADVINMSLRALITKAGRNDAVQKEVTAAYNVATNYANSKGVVVVVAAGNDALNIDSQFRVLPAHADRVISVAASSPVDWGVDPGTSFYVPASYTNYGRKSVDFGGPGGDFDSGNFNLCTVAVFTNVCVAFDGVLSTSPGPAWFWASGTSMASPHAAGVAALLKSKYPWASPLTIRNQMKYRADKVGTNPGDDDFFGWGHVDAINGATGEAPAGSPDVLQLAGDMPESFALDQNYPNPFNPTTAIVFDLAQQVQTRLAVYDLLGREVKVLVDGMIGAGRHEVQFNAANLPSGTYFYKIDAGDFSEIRQMLLLK